MKPTLLSLLSINLILSASAQAPSIEWQNTIGGSSLDELHSIQQTADGGYILGGESASGISGDKADANQGLRDYWAIKLDAGGKIEWQNTIGGSKEDFCHSIQQTADGGYILGGYSESGISGDKTEALQGVYDYWVIKLDTAGNIIWQNTIGGNGFDVLTSIQQTTDEGYILGGFSGSGISGDKTEAHQGYGDYWVIKLDTAGNIVWQNTIGGAGDEFLYSIRQTADGGYILGGYSTSGISGDKTEDSHGFFHRTDYWIVKLDAAGNIVWQNTIGGNSYDELYSIQQTADGSYILGGFSGSGVSEDKTEATQGGVDYWVINLDASGNIIWQNTIGGDNSDELRSIQQTTDGGYIIGGYSKSGISGDKTEAAQNLDWWVIKLGDVRIISGKILSETGTPIPGVTITLSGDDTLSGITDISGRYSFTVRPNSSHSITPFKNNDVAAHNGITSIDVLLMRRHILGNGTLGSPYKIIAAAECNAAGDTLVSTNDILLTRSLILGNANSYPTNRLWQFIPSDYVFPDNNHPFPFPTSRTYTNITTNQTNQNFIGIKLGDVNGSWDANTP